jgi:hypothetical protein
MRVITDRWPSLLGFDIGRLDKLGPLHRRLCRLSLNNRLHWAHLAYFSQSEALPLSEVQTLSEELAG